jgi:hypothetical protein
MAVNSRRCPGPRTHKAPRWPLRQFVELAVVGVIALLSGCATNRALGNSLETGATDAAIVGRIAIRYNGEDVTEGSALLFNEHMVGTYGYSVPKDGWILMSLPARVNHLNRLGFARAFKGTFHYDFQSSQTSFNIPSPGQTYYLGHITVEWTGKGFKPSQMFGVVGAIVDESSNDGTLRLVVEDKMAEASSLLKQRFGRDVPLTKALLGAG